MNRDVKELHEFIDNFKEIVDECILEELMKNLNNIEVLLSKQFNMEKYMKETYPDHLYDGNSLYDNYCEDVSEYK